MNLPLQGGEKSGFLGLENPKASSFATVPVKGGCNSHHNPIFIISGVSGILRKNPCVN